MTDPKEFDIDDERLRAIYKQAEYQKNLSPPERFKIAMEHLEGLRRMKRMAKRVRD
ncbi:MAG: hypothetical protein ACTSW1_15160 [Candidatus Hodarchaeales archaeon]